MLSVTTATVHCSMCPNTPTNTSPERKDKSWSCDFNLAKNARGRGQASTCKNLDLRLGTPVELNVEVSHHTTDEELKTPDSKKPPQSSVSTSKLRRHSVGLLRKNRCPNQRRITDELTNDDVQGHDEETEERDDQQSTEEMIKFSSDENEVISSKNEDKSFSSSSPLPATGGKRKRQTESRISVALKMLKPEDNEPIYATSRKNHDTTIQDDTPKPSLTSLDTTEEPSENTPYVQYVSWNDLVESRDGNLEYQTRENWPNEPQDYSSNHRDNWDDLRQDCYYWLHNREESRNSWDESSAPPPPEPEPENLPYYMVGFPNPPGENRCWLNATLQMLLALPLNDYLARLNLDRSSALTQTFVALQQFWKQGAEKTDVMLRTIKKFRGQLSVLDRLYSSEAQQDVSEFLTLLLNHMKNDCETMLKVSSDESENVPDNSQNSENIVRSPSTTPTKRPPLTQISPFKRQITCNDTTDRQTDGSSPNKQLPEEPSSQQMKNPINELFNISMVEHQICHNCKKRQQRRVDELMLYVSVPNNETDSLDLAEAINKTNAPVKGDSTCSKCNGNEHTFYRKFKECPNVLIVQINRYAISDGCIAKMNTTVHIPEALTLSTVETQNAPAQEHVFVPVCAIAHVGGAMDCGHYTSYVRHGDQWFYYNDMSVEPMSSAEALSAVETTAYLVFFANANFLPSIPALTEEITEEEVSR